MVVGQLVCENFAVELAEIISRDWGSCGHVLDDWCKDRNLTSEEKDSSEMEACPPTEEYHKKMPTYRRIPQERRVCLMVARKKLGGYIQVG